MGHMASAEVKMGSDGFRGGRESQCAGVETGEAAWRYECLVDEQ